MKILASYNIKGGVGKTAAAVNLAYLAAQRGYRTLLWDLDPQGAASFYFRIKPKVKGGVKRLFARRAEMMDAVRASDYPALDLLPADFSYRNLDLLLDSRRRPKRRLRKFLKPARSHYDLVLIDCPPSISLVSENIFTAADALLVPTIPTTLSLRTLQQLLEFCRTHGCDGLSIWPFFSMVDRRKRLHQLIVESPPQGLPGLLRSVIPYASEVERMGLARTAVPAFAPGSLAARAYQALWAELESRVFR